MGKARSKRQKKTPELIAEEKRAQAVRAEAERLAARARDLDAVGIQREAAALASAENIQVIRSGDERQAAAEDGQEAGKKVDHDVARRVDVFESLRSSMTHFKGAYDAARRFEAAMLLRLGMVDKGRALTRVDCEARADRTDKMVAAGREVDAVTELLSDREGWLLRELCVPSKDYEGWVAMLRDANGEPMRGPAFRGWRAVVAHITGETNPNAQGAAVRSACYNLAEAYVRLERKAKVAA